MTVLQYEQQILVEMDSDKLEFRVGSGGDTDEASVETKQLESEKFSVSGSEMDVSQ